MKFTIKFTIKSLLALMTGAVMLESCNDSDYFETTKSDVAKTGNMSFTATVDGAESRASFFEDRSYYVPSFMKSNNEISVFSSGENNKFTNIDNPFGDYTGKCEKSDKYYAISPYSENHQFYTMCKNSDTFIVDWNGAEQIVDLNENYAPMLACAANVEEYDQDDVPLVFQHLCAFFKFTTDYACKSITLKSRGGERLAAKTIYVIYGSNGKLNIFYAGSPSRAITLTGKNGGTIKAGTYYIPVMPGWLSKGVDLTITSEFNLTYTLPWDLSGYLVRGKAFDLGTLHIGKWNQYYSLPNSRSNWYSIAMSSK